MKLFTVGPVEMYPETLRIEGTQLPYFRDESFGHTMKKIEKLFLKSVNAPDNTYFAGLTCSGTGGMDAAVQNTLSTDDKVLVLNGGSFGQRFADICIRYGIPTDTHDIEFESDFIESDIEAYAGKGYSALLVNACETGTGRLYDLNYLGDFCARNDMLFIVDAVSAFPVDTIDMSSQHIDVLITSSHKGLACSPGVVLLALSERARARVHGDKASYYFDLNTYIENQKRGQPPFTSAIGVMLALCERLESITTAGMKETVNMHKERAVYFRNAIKELPVKIPAFPLSNCCTPVLFPEGNAQEIYRRFRDEYGFVLTPSGGSLGNTMLRVGHMGNITMDDLGKIAGCLEKCLRWGQSPF